MDLYMKLVMTSVMSNPGINDKSMPDHYTKAVLSP